MIHTANNFTAKHHRYLLQFVQVGLQTLPLPGDTGRKEDGTSKRIRRSLHASAGPPEPSTSAATQQTIFQSAPAQTPGEPSSHLLPHVAQQQPAMAQPLAHNLSMGNLIDSRPQESSPTGQLISPFSHSEQPPFDPTANGAFGLGPYMLGPGADQGDMTRASELLGVPSLGMGFTAKVPPNTQDPAMGELGACCQAHAWAACALQHVALPATVASARCWADTVHAGHRCCLPVWRQRRSGCRPVCPAGGAGHDRARLLPARAQRPLCPARSVAAPATPIE